MQMLWVMRARTTNQSDPREDLNEPGSGPHRTSTQPFVASVGITQRGSCQCSLRSRPAHCWPELGRCGASLVENTGGKAGGRPSCSWERWACRHFCGSPGTGRENFSNSGSTGIAHQQGGRQDEPPHGDTEDPDLRGEGLGRSLFGPRYLMTPGILG